MVHINKKKKKIFKKTKTKLPIQAVLSELG